MCGCRSCGLLLGLTSVVYIGAAPSFGGFSGLIGRDQTFKGVMQFGAPNHGGLGSGDGSSAASLCGRPSGTSTVSSPLTEIRPARMDDRPLAAGRRFSLETGLWISSTLSSPLVQPGLHQGTHGWIKAVGRQLQASAINRCHAGDSSSGARKGIAQLSSGPGVHVRLPRGPYMQRPGRSPS